MSDGRLLAVGALVGLAFAKAAQGSRGVVRAGRRPRKKIPLAVPGERPPLSPYRADGTAKDEVDEHAVHELVITTISDGELYPSAKRIAVTVAKHLKKDRFDRVRAAKAFEELADLGARKIGWDQHEQPRAKHWFKQKLPTYYPAKVRRAASWDLFEHYVELIEELANEDQGSRGVVRVGKLAPSAYGDEVVVYLSNQNRLRCNSYPADLTYLRVTDSRGEELLHRRVPEDLEPELGEVPREVAAEMLGAILDACGHRKRQDPEYGVEDVVGLAGYGWICVAGDGGSPLDYVRVVNAQGVEDSFWSIDEIVDTPAEVLGALMGVVRGFQP